MNRIKSILVFATIVILAHLSAYAQRTATATATVVNGFVVAITLNDGGTGYITAPAVTITGGGGSGATAIATITNGAVSQVIVENAGRGYATSPTITISPPPSEKPPFSDGLVAYYPFNGNANDESGNGNDGTVFGAEGYEDRFGGQNRAYGFNGTDQYISLPPASFLNGAQTVTISFWVKDNYPTRSGSFLGDWNEAAGGGIYLNNYSGSYFSIALLPNGQVITSSESLIGKWEQVVVVFDGTRIGNEQRLVCYFNGVSNALSFNYTIPNTLGSGSSAILVGARQQYGTPDDFFLGQVDDVRIYNRALSNNEVMGLFKYESGDRSSLTIDVKQVRVNMFVIQGRNYQLESTSDFTNWTKIGNPFTATDYSMYRDFDVINSNRYFRIYQVNP